ncbi:MAG TPA: bacteriohopanetetrol glucosamine biosynthesis glycosyltransferase HpnI [Syntrophobacteria bacterium]|nr:bacteriohopanetetrol glucosamine biosynthesis glycosyltransferase HpnI [Syntrophobacteria bacterium]
MLCSVLPFIIILPPLAYALFTLWCGRAFFSRRREAADHTPPVTILKPVKGVDAGSFENFASFCRQDYPNYQIVFACASENDPVISVIRKLIVAYPSHDIGLVVDGRVFGSNYKVCNLMNAFPMAKHDIIIVCDSDIRVGEGYLRAVCAPFADPGIGLVTSLYRTSSFQGVPCAIEAMGFTAEMVPNVMVARKLEGLSFSLGASMAVRREALEQIGGFRALVDYLADDYQLGNKIYRAGWRLALSDYRVESVMHRAPLANILSRQLRWARTVRVCRPRGYFASVITQPFPAACLALLVAGCAPAGLAAVGLLYLLRSLVALVYSRAFLRDNIFPRWLWLLPVRDGIAFVTWGLAFLGNRVHWRGHWYRLLPGGRIMELPPRY